jgi:hypothetical protein
VVVEVNVPPPLTPQVTPAFAASLVMTAVRVAMALGAMVVGAPVIETEMLLLECALPPQPATINAVARYKNNFK